MRDCSVIAVVGVAVQWFWLLWWFCDEITRLRFLDLGVLQLLLTLRLSVGKNFFWARQRKIWQLRVLVS